MNTTKRRARLAEEAAFWIERLGQMVLANGSLETLEDVMINDVAGIRLGMFGLRETFDPADCEVAQAGNAPTSDDAGSQIEQTTMSPHEAIAWSQSASALGVCVTGLSVKGDVDLWSASDVATLVSIYKQRARVLGRPEELKITRYHATDLGLIPIDRVCIVVSQDLQLTEADA